MTPASEATATDNEMIAFARELVRIPSYSGGEEAVLRHIATRMHDLGYDEVRYDSMGNLLGRIGPAGGRPSILFDSHADTVEVNDQELWTAPPFGAEIRGGRLYGRGSVDMKSSIAASVYAAAAAREKKLTGGATVYVSCTVMEEDCDGENLKHMLREIPVQPDFAVICEPSGNMIALGHKGKAQIQITTQGVAAHGSAPEKGENAVYAMAEIIRRVEELNNRLSRNGGTAGTVVLSHIHSTAESLNAVPYRCRIYLDRRLAPGETVDALYAEMDQIVAGTGARWEPGTLQRESWTGMKVTYEPIHPPWEISRDEPLVRAAATAHHRAFGSAPDAYEYWDFSTNAVATVAMGIPTIGFGPGDYKLAHTRDENCPLEAIVQARSFYTHLVGAIDSP